MPRFIGVLLVMLLTAGTASARGDDCCAPACAPAAPAFRTVTCVQYVPEQYQTTRTTYKTECRQEAYTAYRCEMVPETRTRTVTCYKMVPETVMETRTVCVKVPVTEQRTVMKTCTKMVPCQETVMVKVDRGHWECKLVEVHHPMRHLCHKRTATPVRNKPRRKRARNPNTKKRPRKPRQANRPRLRMRLPAPKR